MTNVSHPPRYYQAVIFGRNGGAERDRTDDLLLARQALSQLSYSPMFGYFMVGLG